MPPPDTLNPVVDIAMDSWGRTWTSIYVGYLAEGAVAYWDNSVWNDIDVSDGLAGPNVKGLAIDSENNVWVATTTGVSKISAIASGGNEMRGLFRIFPNPAHDVIYLSNSDKSIHYVKMYNNLGVLVYEKKHKNGFYSIDVSLFPKGLYYANIQLSDVSIIRKIVVY